MPGIMQGMYRVVYVTPEWVDVSLDAFKVV